MSDHLDELTHREESAADAPSAWGGLAISTITLTASSMIAVQLAFRAWALFGGWFQQDDFRLMARSVDSDLTWDFLTQQYDGQFMPGAWAVQWVMTDLAPLGWGWHAALLLLVQAAVSVGVYRLLVTLFGRRPMVLALLAVALFSVISLPGMLWWAAALNQLPLQLALVYGLSAHVSYLRNQRMRHAVVAAAWACFGLLFYAKAALLFILIAFVTLVYFANGTPTTRVRSVARRYGSGLGLYVGICAVYLLGLMTSSGPASALAWDTGDTFWGAIRAFGTALPAGILGGPLGWYGEGYAMSTADPPLLQVILAAAVLLLIAEQSITSRRHSIPPWVFLVLVAFVDLLLAALYRGSAFGTLGLEYRHFTELAVVAAVCIGLAWAPIPGSSWGPERRSTSFLEQPRVVVLLAFAVSAAGLVSAALYTSNWHDGNKGEGYFDNVRRDLSQSADSVDLVDSGIPDDILWGYAYPENLQSRQFRLLSHDVSFPTSSSDLNIVTPEGRVVSVLMKPVARTSPGPVDGCGHAIQADPLTLPIAPALTSGEWWLQVSYLASASTSLSIQANDAPPAVVTVRQGLGNAWTRVDAPIDEVTLQLTGPTAVNATLCTDDVTLGRLVPADFE